MPDVIRELYPFKATISKGNAYGLPVGKEFLCARVKDGDGSPFPIEVYSFAGDYRLYQLAADEVILRERVSDHASHPGPEA
jgi:hypothetical protein